MMEFVADPGTAWCGDFKVFEEIVQGVKAAGGTAIKPQLWPKSVYKGHEMEKEALRAYINEESLRRMTGICVALELSMFCSVFSIESFKMMMKVAADYPPMGERVKISCSMNKNWKLIDEILKWEIDEVFISVASKEDEMELLKHGVYDHHSTIKLLYCVPKYPTTPEDLAFMDAVDEDARGFSDHTVGVVAPITAAALGFDMIEKHVKLTAVKYESMLGDIPRFPDEVCAISTPNFLTMIEACKDARRMAGYD